MSEKKLSEREERFCQEFSKCLNRTKAAMAAGYTQNAAAAAVQGSRLLKNPKIQERIQELFDSRAKRTQITGDRILVELLKLATSDLGRAFDKEGRLRSIDQMPASIRRAISAVKVFEEHEGFGKDRVKVGETTEIKLWDKTKALELLGKHLKLFTDKVELTGRLTLEQLVMGSMEGEKPPGDDQVASGGKRKKKRKGKK